MKSNSQVLPGSGNEFKSNWKREIQVIWCLNNFIYSNCPGMLYNVEELLNLSGKLGVIVRLAFNLRSTALIKFLDANRYDYFMAVGSLMDC